jgi:hypothetical protein
MNAAVDPDVELEQRIEGAYQRTCKAIREDDRRKWLEEMVALVKQRSPEQIRKMERERRLSR